MLFVTVITEFVLDKIEYILHEVTLVVEAHVVPFI